MSDYYKKKLQQGLEYQDFVFDQFRHMDGMPIFLGAYSSQKYQYEKGESPSGIEIKYDSQIKKYQSIFIEIAEKSDASLPNYTPSGVMRDDNTWLYLVGDYEQAFIFPKRKLQVVCNPDNPYIDFKEIATARGYSFPLDYIERESLCAKHVVFDQETKLGS